MENMQFCQSCGMPMTDDAWGTEKNGAKSADYCSYCYKEGAFTGEMTMDEMIDFCVGPMVENNKDMTPESAKEMMQKFFPSLKRWKTA